MQPNQRIVFPSSTPALNQGHALDEVLVVVVNMPWRLHADGLAMCRDNVADVMLLRPWRTDKLEHLVVGLPRGLGARAYIVTTRSAVSATAARTTIAVTVSPWQAAGVENRGLEDQASIINLGHPSSWGNVSPSRSRHASGTPSTHAAAGGPCPSIQQGPRARSSNRYGEAADGLREVARDAHAEDGERIANRQRHGEDLLGGGARLLVKRGGGDDGAVRLRQGGRSGTPAASSRCTAKDSADLEFPSSRM